MTFLSPLHTIDADCYFFNFIKKQCLKTVEIIKIKEPIMKLTEKLLQKMEQKKELYGDGIIMPDGGLPSDPGWTLKKLSCPFFHIQKTKSGK